MRPSSTSPYVEGAKKRLGLGALGGVGDSVLGGATNTTAGVVGDLRAVAGGAAIGAQSTGCAMVGNDGGAVLGGVKSASGTIAGGAGNVAGAVTSRPKESVYVGGGLLGREGCDHLSHRRGRQFW